MEILDYLNEEIYKIEKDNRFNYPKSNVQVNAPLALIQVDLTARHRALKDVIEFIGTSKTLGEQINDYSDTFRETTKNHRKMNIKVENYTKTAT